MTKLVATLCLAACADAADPAPTTPIAIHTKAATGLSIDRPAANATWVGVLDGDDGEWQPLVGTAGEYTAEVTHGRYSVAIVCADLSPAVTVLSRSISDPRDLTAVCDSFFDEPAHRISARVENGPDAAQVRVMPFLLGQLAIPNVIGGGVIEEFLYEGNAGKYDLVSLGDVDGDLTLDFDHLIVERDLDLAFDPVVDINPNTASYLPFGPDRTVTARGQVTLAVDYITSRGTVVPLADVETAQESTTATYPSWPLEYERAGDAYRVHVIRTEGFSTLETVAFVREPAAMAPAVPAAFDAKLVPSATAVERVELTRVADAARYGLVCQTTEHRIAYDLSASWLGDDTAYELPVLPLDPAIPALAVEQRGCRWEASASGSTHGIAIDDELAQIGVVALAPGKLVGVEQWTASRSLSQ